MMYLVVALSAAFAAQDTLHIEEAYKLAAARFPLAKNIALQQEIYERKSDNLAAQYLPSLSVAGQASYQSETIEIPLPDIPGLSVPEALSDQYQVTVSVNQLVYDGGASSAQRAADNAQRRVDEASIEVQLYALRKQIDEAYFSLLLLGEQEKSLDMLERDITTKRDVLRARVREGTVLPAAVDILSAELLKLRQNRSDMRAARRTALGVLSRLLGEDIGEATVFAVPHGHMPEGTLPTGRPEYRLYQLTRERIGTMADLIDTRYLPRVQGYVQAAYARPGLNPFRTDFHLYYTAGIRLNWMVWDWNIGGREKEIITLQQQAVDNQRSAFAEQISVEAERYQAEAARIEEILQTDDEIIALRGRIVRETESRVENGVLTASEYVTELHAEAQARLNKEIHRLQLQRAAVNFRTTLGE